MGGLVLLTVRFYLYGAGVAAADAAPAWQAWMAAHFPSESRSLIRILLYRSG